MSVPRKDTVDWKVRAILPLLRKSATPEKLRALTEEQWELLGERAGVAKPSPLVRARLYDLAAKAQEGINGCN